MNNISLAGYNPKVKKSRYVRNVTTHADANDWTGYETHAFNRATLAQVARRDSRIADKVAAGRDEDGELLWLT